MKTALLLAGGGARGIIQAGMLSAFHDLDIQYDALYGSSVGALNGALMHQFEHQSMMDLWLKIKSSDVYSWAPWNSFNPKASFFDSSPLQAKIRKLINPLKLCSNAKPFNVNVTNYVTWETEAWNSLSSDPATAHAALIGSASPPVAFPPKDKFIDGGIINNFSIAQAVNDGADRLIIMTPTRPEPKQIKNIIDMLDTVLALSSYGYLKRELRFVEKLNSVPGFRTIDVVLIQPDKPTGIGLLDFDYKQSRLDLLGYGYRLAMEALKDKVSV